MRSLLLLLSLLLVLPASAQDDPPTVADLNYNALAWRGIGPAFTSGRIADIAIHPDDPQTWYVAVGSGGVWMTANSGTTWTSLFDGQASYSTGSIAIDARNPSTIWVGTGENIGGRHAAYGDGIYRSTDGGRTWENRGLAESERLSTIWIHPDDSDVVLVAAQGPLWSAGGERGLYRTEDAGETWTQVLGGGDWTGATDLVVDPRDPDVMYAATWDRHRTVAAYMGGGPGTGLHKSTDGGQTWTEMTRGLPRSNMGKIGLAISPQNPDVVYAAIETDQRTGGLWMSADRGASWRKMSDAVAGGTGPHYYQELYASPHHEGRIYLMDVRVQQSNDHGATFFNQNTGNKHVDNHALAFHPTDPDYLLSGTDGGLYESIDGGESWRYIDNLPVIQYYKVAVDDALPFYNIYGGTQDNNSQGGPSATDTREGAGNGDWFITLGGDGHQSATEPGNPNITYAQSQQGNLHRIDQITGEATYIVPQAGPGEGPERYNWDAPILVSPHDPATLYFASQRVWMSTDRGDSWTALSGDLTRNEERFELPIMGRTQSIDNAWDVYAMSVYNTITSVDVSAQDADLIYAGTDDGLLQVTEDGGGTWRAVEVGSIAGVPERAFVNHVYADLHDANTVYAALDNHKYGDFAPYLVKSTDRGRTWAMATEGIPERTLVWRLVQDHVQPDLLFAATEFGVYFSPDRGGQWIELGGDMPTIGVRDLVIQRRENDLVAGTFGRGFLVLDDYSPLREVTDDVLAGEGHLFGLRDARRFNYRRSTNGSVGDDEYRAPNPEYGAVFTYYLRDGYQSLEAQRREAEGEVEDGDDVPFPGWDALDAERNEEADRVELHVRDAQGDVVARVAGRSAKGLHRVAWDLERDALGPVTPGEQSRVNGFEVEPGTYSATLVRVADGQARTLSGPVSFDVVPLRDGALRSAEPADLAAFRARMEGLMTDMTLFSNAVERAGDRIEAIEAAHDRARRPEAALAGQIDAVQERLYDLDVALYGSPTKRSLRERTPPSMQSRMFVGYRGLTTQYGPTPLHLESVDIAERELQEARGQLDAITAEIAQIADRLPSTGAPVVDMAE
ncbi:MAG: glycosyl hydrolase [Bacteroidota bacterium]